MAREEEEQRKVEQFAAFESEISGLCSRAQRMRCQTADSSGLDLDSHQCEALELFQNEPEAAYSYGLLDGLVAWSSPLATPALSLSVLVEIVVSAGAKERAPNGFLDKKRAVRRSLISYLDGILFGESEIAFDAGKEECTCGMFLYSNVDISRRSRATSQEIS